MTKIIVDTNIVFSAILNLDSTLSKILIEGGLRTKFYAPSFLTDEISSHQERICELKHFSSQEFNRVYFLVTKHITFINSYLVSTEDFKMAIELCKPIDPNDVEFVALALHLKGKLWTGDKKLSNGLTAQKWNEVVTTQQLLTDLKES